MQSIEWIHLITSYKIPLNYFHWCFLKEKHLRDFFLQLTTKNSVVGIKRIQDLPFLCPIEMLPR